MRTSLMLHRGALSPTTSLLWMLHPTRVAGQRGGASGGDHSGNDDALNGSAPSSSSNSTAATSSSNDSQITTTTSGVDSLEKRQLKEAEKKGSTLGFMRRQEFDSHTWMLKNFAEAETLPSGIKVFNLPPAPRADHDFEMYQKTTSDFISPVNPNSLSGVGLGAGFGSRPDKRLGWLRPKKDHLSPLPPEVEEKRIMAQIHKDGNQDVPEAKTPEERKQQIERMLQYMKSYDGTALSRQEHFLLVDLDYEKDSLLFGNTRQDFIQNVEKLKQVILQYNKWERTDNIYYYTTLFIKFASVWLLVDCVQTYQRFRVLRDSLDEFEEMTHEEINALKEKRGVDFAKVRAELISNPPDFTPVVKTILEERRKAIVDETVLNARAAKEAAEKKSVETLLADTMKQALGGDSSASDTSSTPPVTTAAQPNKTMEIMKSASHPMDTTFEVATQRREAAEKRKLDMEKFAAPTVDDSQKKNTSIVGRTVGFVTSLFKKKPSDSVIGRGSNAIVLDEPLSQADYARFSYAAAPTSIATVRAVRRLMLPRSDDFTQMVREEMLEYKAAKDASTEYR
ncbi:Hypothetical protein, putative [Bodo saltans]|uniref:Uncharacterized protein n=1 Tax=Bodo saltans TaxID=75058 RepID=A0A0S4JAR7_BODSA|nr:Hypothetical protein, putative [Bodo saltans]|eukprot:CUG83132.1 Hypothetical protein, putative [Bodo saltans]